MKGNPIELTEDELLEILKKANLPRRGSRRDASQGAGTANKQMK
jgi:hypothetical protein